MKIEKIYIDDFGPIDGTVSPIDLRNSWEQTIHSSILLSGPNGSGKTILLNSIAYLWDALAIWLSYGKPISEEKPAGRWLAQWGGIAVIIDELPDFAAMVGKSKTFDTKICLFYGKEKFIKKTISENLDIHYIIGQLTDPANQNTLYLDRLQISGENRSQNVIFEDIPYSKKPFNISIDYFKNWGKIYKMLVLGGNGNSSPNMIYLDAEERQWIKPEHNIGDLIPDDMTQRWQFRYQASKDWKNQMENALVNYKITAGQKEFKEIIKTLNMFLTDKEIMPQIRPQDRNRFRIKLKTKKHHYFDALSSGERQVLIMLFNIMRWMERGGIVMVDEPDLFLHPSLVPRLLATLEEIVEKKEGQLLITSHNKDVWNRYQNLGKRITLGEPL